MPRPPRIFLTSTRDYPFIQDDVENLQEEFQIDRYVGSGTGAMRENYLRARRADVSISWFGSVYSAAMVRGAKRRGKKSIIILGGVDVASEPELGYGIWRSRWKGRMLAYALRNADRVFAVDASLRDSLERSSGMIWPEVEVLPTGYDSSYWQPGETKERMVLTVANCDIPGRIPIKGIDLLLEAARMLDDLSFTVIGIAPSLSQQLRSLAPPNLRLLPPLPRTSLLEHYQRAAIYCQPSRREGLPNTLCEAMLCGCIPVGSDVGGIPGAIGSTGFIFRGGDLDTLCMALRDAVDAPAERGAQARERIAMHYSRNERKRKLIATIRELAGA